MFLLTGNDCNRFESSEHTERSEGCQIAQIYPHCNVTGKRGKCDYFNSYNFLFSFIRKQKVENKFLIFYSLLRKLALT